MTRSVLVEVALDESILSHQRQTAGLSETRALQELLVSSRRWHYDCCDKTDAGLIETLALLNRRYTLGWSLYDRIQHIYLYGHFGAEQLQSVDVR